jgi:hypothetical protein
MIISNRRYDTIPENIAIITPAKAINSTGKPLGKINNVTNPANGINEVPIVASKSIVFIDCLEIKTATFIKTNITVKNKYILTFGSISDILTTFIFR